VDNLTKEFVAESQEGLERMELCLTELERRPDDPELLSEIFRAVHTIKGATGFLGFSRLEKLAHTGESLLGTLRDGRIQVTSELISGLLDLMDGLRTILRLIEATGTEGVRATEDDHELIALLMKLKAGDGKLALDGKPASQNHDVGAPVSLPIPAAASSAVEQTLRVDVAVLNRMMNLVGDLVLTRNQILQSSPGAENFPDLARKLNSVTAELRESVMQARMQPVGHLFRKFPRMVRDLAKICGRQVRIEFEGQETGLDKSLLEAIRDPLTHAVRNSVDHGIETADQRIKAGKPIEGIVRLRAFQQSGSVVIEVIDDGAGISTERVLAKAIERGLVTPEQASSMTQREALQMIFVAGFSTAKEVTNVSGRGVGMDVVRANVEKVGGSVELESRVGCGTTVRLRVPLTLAIVPALVVRSGGQSFALPQRALVKLVYVPPRDAESAVERIGTTDLYRLREGLLPLVWLDRVLGLEQTESMKSHGFYIAVVESEGRRFGLVVADLKPPEEIVVKPLSPALREIGLFSGATVLANGMLALILDLTAMAARAGVRPTAEGEQFVSAKTELPRSEFGRVEPEHTEIESAMVIYETWKHGFDESGDRRRMALPLSAVERIERVPITEIEYAGGRAVLQYGGELLPLEDEDELLREMRLTNATAHTHALHPGPSAPGSGAVSTPSDAGGMTTVLICQRPGTHAVRRMGIVVRRVLAVSAGTLLQANAGLCDGPLAMVKNRVTMVRCELVAQAGAPAQPVMQEVA
jgi:two-component system, chemotaxis family, sensor kinase CheA